MDESKIKLCNKCGVNPRRPGKRRTYCASCHSKYQMQHRKTPQGRATFNRAHTKWRRGTGRSKWLAHHRKCNLKRKFGLSVEEYDRMVLDQKGVCLLCQKPPANRRLPVDHDHKNGKIRGLLCGPCNIYLGKIERIGVDEFVRRIVLYLNGDDNARRSLRIQGD